MAFAQLAGEQRVALHSCINHILGYGKHQHIVFGASAGSGKTFTVNHLRDFLNRANVAHKAIAYTGRAASRIRARTCHSLLYEPILDANGDLIRWARIPAQTLRENVGAGILVDEGSMIPYQMHKELTEIGVPICYVGDYAQLGPVDDSNKDFNVMNSLDVEHVSLEEMRRFDENSGIAEVAQRLRTENTLLRLRRDDVRCVARAAVMKPAFFDKYDIDMVACGKNATRKRLTRVIRAHRGYDHSKCPEVGEKVVCLRNDVANGNRINNGELFTVVFAVHGDVYGQYILVNDDTDERVTVNVMNETWETETGPKDFQGKKMSIFGFGYAMTVHKLQGSSINKLLFIDEDVSFFTDQRRFRYTGVTRAAEQLYMAI